MQFCDVCLKKYDFKFPVSLGASALSLPVWVFEDVKRMFKALCFLVRLPYEI